jgi:hypothetical protein
MKYSIIAAVIAATFIAVIFIGAGLAVPDLLWAYDMQLDSSALHEAYILGQRNDKATGDFLAAYLKEISEPQNAVHIAQIALFTPYAQIVERSRQSSDVGYTEEQAAKDYHEHGNTVAVNAQIMLPAAYPKADEAATGTQKSAIRPENFWQNFKFNLKQNGKTIAPRSIINKPIHSTATKDTPAVLDGENVWLEFDVKDVASDLTTVEVVTPEGKNITATFDLKKLR